MYPRTAVALALALALALAAPAVAQVLEKTTGKRLDAAPGFTFASDVAGYLKVSNDVCNVADALNGPTPGFAAAKAVYADGKNSRKSDGALRTLKGMATGSYEEEPFWDAYTKTFGSKNFADDAVSKALDGVAPLTAPAARSAAAKRAVDALVMAYTMHELDEAAYKIKTGELSDASGAPHNVDEAFALYVGEKTACSPWGLSNTRAALFGTLETCSTSKANSAFVAAAAQAQAAARKGDIKAFLAARSKMQSAFAVTAVQGTLQYAADMEAARAAKKPTDEAQAAAYYTFRTIEPLVAQASASSAEAIRKLLIPGSRVVAGADAQVQAALEKAYAGLGITKADVGTLGAKTALKC